MPASPRSRIETEKTERSMLFRLSILFAFLALILGVLYNQSSENLLWKLMPSWLATLVITGAQSFIGAQVSLLDSVRDRLPETGLPIALSEERSIDRRRPWHGHSATFKYNTKRRRDPPQHLVDPVEMGWPIEEDDARDQLAGIAPPQSPKDHRRSEELESEALATLGAAVELREAGRLRKASRLFDHARALAPDHPDVLNELGLFLERRDEDVVGAERLYARALAYAPHHSSALRNRERTLPLVEQIDQKMLSAIDAKREIFASLPRTSPRLRRALKEAYFLHVYHTVAIEGNTMSLLQTRSILETHLAVAGKSVVEHNEIMGMDQALRFLNKTLLHRIGDITIHDIKEIHHRVLGFVDPFQAGKFRDHQVYVGDFTPVPCEEIRGDMEAFVEWLNSEDALGIHPVEMAAIAHYKFVYIHPFVDGNGRTARLLMNLILMQAGFPPVIVRVEDRLGYYETLKAANEGDLRPFIRFIAAAADRTLGSYLAATQTPTERRRDEITERREPSSGQLTKDVYSDDLFKL